MFYEYLGEIFRLVKRMDEGAWIISYDHPREPIFISESKEESMTKIAFPAGFLECMEKELTEGQKRREALIYPLITNERCMYDRKERRRVAKEVAVNNRTTIRRIQLLYYRYLAGRPLVEVREVVEKPKTDMEKVFTWAIEEFYYSAKRPTLQTSYDLMILARYVDENGVLKEGSPTWWQFRHFFYKNEYHKRPRREIAREGLSNYQRNQRGLHGSETEWRKRIGAYQMDATQADIYLVSRKDKSAVVGRPHIYMAVDTVTQLIAGVYVGFEDGEEAVIACLCNAAEDKVAFAKRFGIKITAEQWPSRGLPCEIITDKGREFTGKRVMEWVSTFGMDIQTLPPFRPDGKGLVEKSFNLLQDRYLPFLRGKGAIEKDFEERWAVDYRNQAVLDLEEFTKIVIHAVLYLNSSRVLKDCPGLPCEADPVPARLWNWYMEQGRTDIIPTDDEMVYRMGLPRAKVTMSRNGIYYKGLLYVHRYYDRIFENVNRKEMCTIAFDINDVSKIYLIKEKEWIPFELAGSYKQYQGVSERELKEQKKKERERRRELQKTEAEGRLKFIKEVRGILEGKDSSVKGRVNPEIIKRNLEKEAM